jgi:hypothetical protein
MKKIAFFVLFLLCLLIGVAAVVAGTLMSLNNSGFTIEFDANLFGMFGAMCIMAIAIFASAWCFKKYLEYKNKEAP